MINIRKSDERGRGEHGWLSSRHTFSFASYYDPKFTGFRNLLVINEDRVQPGRGFGAHSHRDMEIISWVLQGTLKHRDSMGHEAELVAGEIQHITAGTGITHSEFNASDRELVHFLQIWIVPNDEGLTPRYSQQVVPEAQRRNKLCLVASGESHGNVIEIHADAQMYVCDLESEGAVQHEFGRWPAGWIQVTSGELTVNGVKLNAGDGAAISEEKRIEIASESGAQFLLFELQ